MSGVLVDLKKFSKGVAGGVPQGVGGLSVYGSEQGSKGRGEGGR